MCCVNKKDVSLSRLCRLQFRRPLFLQKFGLNGDMLFETFFGGTGIARTRCHFSPMRFRKCRT